MKKLNVWMLLCILFCGLTLTSCKDVSTMADGLTLASIWTQVSVLATTSLCIVTVRIGRIQP